MEYFATSQEDEILIKAAIDVIEKNYRTGRHSVGAAVLCSSGNIYTGVNIDTCGYGPCAEPIALGAAICNGEREFLSIIAVEGWNAIHAPMSPCGNCRQLLLDYAPEAFVLLHHERKLIKVRAKNLLPDAYHNFEHV